ncbi:MAG: hypothetical protein WCS73_10305 [Lentisphaeria bacterium]
MCISKRFLWKKISPEDEKHYFFGYYDRCPWNDDDSLHLCLKVNQASRLPVKGETAEIGVLDGSGSFEHLATTRTWCHQQGAMELFLPHRNQFIYNDFDGEKVVARIYEMGKGIVGKYNRGIYTISPNGRFGISLDFARIPRRGYSYAEAPLPDDVHPKNLDHDGLWLVDLVSGAEKLLVSYSTMLKKHPWRYSCEDVSFWLNHAIFNCDSSRILWLFRQHTQANVLGNWWHTFMYTCDLEGRDTACVLPETYWHSGAISHQIWGRTPHEILVDANWDGTGNHAVVFDESQRPFLAKKISESHGGMAHMVFSPDGTKLLADSYPVNGKQQLDLIDVATGKMEQLGVFAHQQPKGTVAEVRCDLHPRWSHDGKKITVDSIHSGKRAVYLLKL